MKIRLHRDYVGVLTGGNVFPAGEMNIENEAIAEALIAKGVAEKVENELPMHSGTGQNGTEQSVQRNPKRRR